MHSLVQPNSWVALKLPSGNLKVLQLVPNTTISLGKYGSFPSNLIIQRPYHLTYELQDKQAGESFCRLRIVPASELYSDILTPTAASSSSEGATPAPENEEVPTGIEYALVDPESGDVVAKTNRAELDASARQTLSAVEIEALKKDGTDAGRDLIAKLMLSHTAIEQKTQYSLEKYKLLKTKKYIRRFSVLPLDTSLLGSWFLEEKDPSRIMDLREEMIALLGCWANVHFGGEDRCENENDQAEDGENTLKVPEQTPGRWLMVDDTGGLLVAAMAERMGILYQPESTKHPETVARPGSPGAQRKQPRIQDTTTANGSSAQAPAKPSSPTITKTETQEEVDTTKPTSSPQQHHKRPHSESKQRWNDLRMPHAQTNTLTVVHPNSQPNMSFLRYYDFDVHNPTQVPTHPLARHLLTLSWLQLQDPWSDPTYASEPPTATPEELRSWKSNRRGNYHRKRRRWAKVRHVVDGTRAGGFAGLVVASPMDPVSMIRHLVPLLAGGAPIAVYSPTMEPLSALADCYSMARRSGWIASPPAGTEGMTPDELERWPGNDDFPLNPTLVLGASVQTSRVRRWQVLPGRTHPLMTSRGGAEGYIFTGWRVKPAEGKVEARGRMPRKRKKTAMATTPAAAETTVTTTNEVAMANEVATADKAVAAE
ncbi:Gcd10p family-domain-containing protein [Xylariomycetidae sp. FL2044]|nr:Gcd10p family-domain-containing protein [Xylariomycetidae sp. FL2044]